MLPTAHLIPCQILDEHRARKSRAVQLQCHEELLPLRESGPGYIAFWPQDELPESAAELDWSALLAGPYDADSILLPRSVVLRTMTPGGQLAGFPLGDPFELEPQGYAVDWADGDLLTLTLTEPLSIADLLGPVPPAMPQLSMSRVAYELTPDQAAHGFGQSAVELHPDHWRYLCWALETFPAALEEQLPTLPHLAVPSETFDAVESLLVFDEAPIEAARQLGWKARGEMWRNPDTGALEDGAIFAGFAPLRDNLVLCDALHFVLAGQVLTSLVPFALKFAPVEQILHRLITNVTLPDPGPR